MYLTTTIGHSDPGFPTINAQFQPIPQRKISGYLSVLQLIELIKTVQ